MNEGRKTQIVLLDEQRLDIKIQPKLYTSDLLDLVSSHFKLREKHYFGLAFLDDTYHFNWLQNDKRVLDHDFPKKSGVLQLYFSVRYYVDTIGLLRDSQTVELFYLNARQAVFKGQIECDSETVFELAAHVLQASRGDFSSDEETREDIKKLPIIPTRTLKEHPSIVYCEDRVIAFYRKLLGTARGLAIVNYMTIVEQLPTYGIHYYEVKDKKDLPWWLGISPKGIAVYDKTDKTIPRKMFTWKNLENLYYRDKKFSIEVHDPKRIVHTLSSFNLYEDAIREPVDQFDDLSDAITDPTTQVSVSRRTFGTSNVNVHAWLASSPQLTKCIWAMAVAQHQFYLERKQSKSSLTSARSMSEIAADLSRSMTSLVGSDLSHSGSSQSLPSLNNSQFDLHFENSEAQKAEQEMVLALKARKEALEEKLRQKMEELKMLCFQEGELTGQMPRDMPLEPGERVPTFRRRVGTSFAISPKAIQTHEGSEDQLATLELEYDLQCKITSAAHHLAQDKSVSKYVRKQRRHSYNKAAAKLKEMEKKLVEARKQTEKTQTRDEVKGKKATSASDSSLMYLESKIGALDRASQENLQHRFPSSPSRSSPTLHPHHSSPQLGYVANSVYDTRTHYRTHMYPTLSSSSSRSTLSPTSSLSPASTRSILDDFSAGSGSSASSSGNLYNLPLKQSSRYESTDMLKSPTSSTNSYSSDARLQLPSKHGSLDRKYKRGDLSYGSLDRKKKQQPYSVEPRDVKVHLSSGRSDMKTCLAQGRGDYEIILSKSTNKVEVPVYHDKNHYKTEPSSWKQNPYSDQSPSLESSHSLIGKTFDCYSPRLTETSHQVRLAREREEILHEKLPVFLYPHQQHLSRKEEQPSHVARHEPIQVPVLHQALQSNQSSVTSQTSHGSLSSSPPPAHSTLVTVTRYQPHMEVTKPYEMADFYKYSERLRKQRIIEHYQRQLMGATLERGSGASTPSLSSDSDSHSLHSSHSGSSFSHSQRLSSVSASLFSGLGSPSRSNNDLSSGALSPMGPQYHRTEHEHTSFSLSDQTPYSGYSGHDQGSFNGNHSFNASSPSNEHRSVHSQGPMSSEYQSMRNRGPVIHYASSSQSQSSYRMQYVHAVASTKHSQYHPPAPMKCQPVTDQSTLKGGGAGK